MNQNAFESKLLKQINSIDRIDEGLGSTILNWLFGSKFKKILKDVTKEEEDFPEYQAALQDLYFNLDKLKDIHTRNKALSKKMGYLK
jgi:hypothetical protein